MDAHSQYACAVCRDIHAKLIQDPHRPEYKHGPVGDILKKPCLVHNFLLHFVLQNPRPGKAISLRDELVLGIDVTKKVHIALLSHTRLYFSSYHELLLVAQSNTFQPPGIGRILDTKWVDMTLLQKWMGECLGKHQSTCENPLQLSKTKSPAWLIDTIDNRLVAGHGISDYFALSYTWGDTTFLQNKLGILEELKQPDALLQNSFASPISPTVKHAIGLTRLLGERYLWVDALCIVQDSDKETADQLELMGVIYAAAKLTIVATDGDASHGIPGLRGVSQPREFSQPIYPLGKSDLMMVRQNPILETYPEGGSAPYFGRAWTFQEFYLSKRRLVIGKKQFHWSCGCKMHNEDMDDPYTGPQRASKFKNIILGLPDMYEFKTLVHEYNGRDLSFPEDALAGASGFLAMLNRGFVGGFIYGIPELFFDRALAWHNSISSTKMERRRKLGSKRTKFRDSQLPSWSWLGWKTGYLSYDYQHSGELSEERWREEYPLTKTITQWYSQETPGSRTKRAIGPSLWDHDSDFKDERSKNLLTQGWTKERFDPSKHIGSGDNGIGSGTLVVLGDYVFMNPRWPKKQFWHPFPIKSKSEDPETIPLQNPFISCRTKRGWFGAKQTSISKAFREKWQAHNISILGKEYKLCGYVELPTKEESSDFPIAESDESRTIELVAISLRRTPIVKSIAEYQGRVKASHFREEYNVLWIEWIDGVAYRKGIGEIEKESWDNHDLEDVDLILG